MLTSLQKKSHNLEGFPVWIWVSHIDWKTKMAMLISGRLFLNSVKSIKICTEWEFDQGPQSIQNIKKSTFFLRNKNLWKNSIHLVCCKCTICYTFLWVSSSKSGNSTVSALLIPWESQICHFGICLFNQMKERKSNVWKEETMVMQLGLHKMRLFHPSKKIKKISSISSRARKVWDLSIFSKYNSVNSDNKCHRLKYSI